MVHQYGFYHMKTVQKRELEKQIKEKKKELLESYRAQKKDKLEMVTSKSIMSTEAQRSIDRGEETMKREEKDEMEGRVGVVEVPNGNHSTPPPERQSHSEPHDDSHVRKTPSFRLNAGKCQ